MLVPPTETARAANVFGSAMESHDVYNSALHRIFAPTAINVRSRPMAFTASLRTHFALAPAMVTVCRVRPVDRVSVVHLNAEMAVSVPRIPTAIMAISVFKLVEQSGLV